MSSQPSAPATDSLDPMFKDFLRRWQNISDLVVSPADHSALHVRGNVLRDASGNNFPILDGAPVLLSDLQHLLTDYYAISRQSGSPPAGLTRAAVGSDDVIECYLFGRLIKLGELHPADTASAKQPPGTLEIVGDEVFVWSASGRFKVNKLWYNANFGAYSAIEDGQTLIDYLGVSSPYFLLNDKFPNVDISTYYELLPFLRLSAAEQDALVAAPAQLSSLDRKNLASEDTSTAGAPILDNIPSIAELEADAITSMTASNAVFFRSIFDDLKIDLEDGGVLDVGGGTGFIAAAMEMAGARRPVSFDVRRPDLSYVHAHYPKCRNMVVAFADMFRWCFSENAYSLIVVRNNGPVCFAADFNHPDIANFLKNCMKSLRDDGILYLTAITGEAQQVDPSGLANRTVAEYIDWVESSGLHVLRLSKLGTQLALLCCKSGARDVFMERLMTARLARRARAWRDYRSGDNDRRTLLNFFLAVGDLAGEVALEAYRKRATSIAFHGTGVLSYYLWRYFYVSFPKLDIIAFVTPKKSSSVIQPQYTPDEARTQLGERCINVLTDDSFYDQVVAGRTVHYPSATEHVLFPSGQSACPPDAERPWFFSLVTGDHDVLLPPSIAGYVSGRLGGLVSDRVLAEGIKFERRLRYFPVGYEGEQTVSRLPSTSAGRTPVTGLLPLLRKLMA